MLGPIGNPGSSTTVLGGAIMLSAKNHNRRHPSPIRESSGGSRLKGLTFIHWVAGASVLILSFTITLWLIEPAVPPVPPVDKINSLAAAAVFDEGALSAAARTAGLIYSSYVMGSVDVLSRVDANHVGISGWAVETIAATTARGAPITVMAFGGGRRIFSVETKGERSDVTSALKLTEETAENVAFAGRLECSPGQKLLIVGATLSGTYALLATKNCP